MEFAELQGKADTITRNWNDGAKLRLGFSIAVHTDLDILLVDEVLGGRGRGVSEQVLPAKWPQLAGARARPSCSCPTTCPSWSAWPSVFCGWITGRSARWTAACSDSAGRVPPRKRRACCRVMLYMPEITGSAVQGMAAMWRQQTDAFRHTPPRDCTRSFAGSALMLLRTDFACRRPCVQFTAPRAAAAQTLIPHDVFSAESRPAARSRPRRPSASRSALPAHDASLRLSSWRS